MRLEYGFFELDRNSAIDGFPNIHAAVILLVKLIDAFQNALSKSTLMRTTVNSVLPIDKRKKVFPVIGRVGKCKFEILPFVIGGFIKRRIINFTAEKIEQAALKAGFGVFAIAIGHHAKIDRKRVDRFAAHAVETHAKLENIVVVFGTGIDNRNALDNFAERNTAPIVAHTDAIGVNCHIDFCAKTRNKFIDGIIHHLFEQNVYAVIGISTRTEPPNVHTRAQPNMLKR